jgi:DNA-binding NarL/FixJ family response regulator
MKYFTQEEREELRSMHRREHDRRVADRIKAVLLADQGWTNKQVAEALFVDEDTAAAYVKDYLIKKKLKHESGGSKKKIT